MMIGVVVALLASLAQGAAPLHESHFPNQADWSIKTEAVGGELHEVIIAVKQLNKQALHDKLMDVSDPNSPNRYNYLTFDEAHSLTANPDAVGRILKWLSDSQITVTKQHKYGHFIHAVAEVSKWEEVLNTKFARVESRDDMDMPFNNVIRAVEDVSVPEHLADAFDGIFKTTQLPLRFSPGPVASGLTASSLDDLVSPGKIRQFYDVFTPKDISSSSQSIFAALNQYFSQDNLKTFMKHYRLSPTTTVKQPSSSPDHENKYMCESSPNNCVEANLDVQQMVGGAPGAPTTFWYTPDPSAIFESWIVAVSAVEKPPQVHSISYGGIEEMWSKHAMNAFNTEVMRLGVQGVTVFVSSGDDGVANFQARNYPSKCGYHPSFPATSPYVTAVGATMGGVDKAVSSIDAEEACSVPQSGITTGGGFSTEFDQAEWQKDAINAYFKKSTAAEPGYRATGRGYPDISMAGNAFATLVGSQWYPVSGTSASSPVVASFATLINAGRHANGKSPIGFINPTLYANPEAFNDITKGNNKCTANSNNCCDQGFYEADGWSPVTGLGSVNFTKFAALFGETAPPESKTESKSKTAMIIGFVVLGVAVLVVIATTVFCCRRCQNQQRPQRQPLV